jgi:hypothetical protein
MRSGPVLELIATVTVSALFAGWMIWHFKD